jgi:O-antigen/teichoic acid export membrane protein
VLIGFLGTAVLRPKILQADEIGFLQVVLNMTVFLAAVFTLGANLITVKMLPQFQLLDSKNNKGLFRLLVYFGAMGCLIGVPIFYFSESLFLQNNQGERFEGVGYGTFFYITVYLVIVIRTFYNLFDVYLRANHLSVPGVFSDSILLKLLPIGILGLFFIGWFNYSQLFYANLFIYLFPLLIAVYFLIRIKAINWVKPGPFSREEKRQMFGISTVGFMEIISYFIVLFIDVFMLKRFMNDEAVGIYTTMFFFGTVISIPYKALVRIAHPIISEAFAKNDFETIATIYRKASNVLFVLGAFVFLLVWENRYSVENFLDPIYTQGLWVIFFIGLAHLTEVLSSVNVQIISITPYYRYNLYIGALTVVLLIATNYIFIQYYGIVGVAIGSFISMVLVNFARFLFLRKRYKLNPFSNRTLKILLVFLAVFGLMEFIPNLQNIYANVILRSTIIAVLFVPAVYFLKCSDDFNAVLDKYLGRLSLKK